MISVSYIAPHLRETAAFCQVMKSNNYAAEPMLRSCGITISSQFTQVQGRVLPAPKVSSLYSLIHCNLLQIFSSFFDFVSTVQVEGSESLELFFLSFSLVIVKSRKW
jgi:hypothetical protein